MVPRLGGIKQKKIIIHLSTSLWFLLFYSPTPRSQVRILKLYIENGLTISRIWHFLTRRHDPFRKRNIFCINSQSTSLGMAEAGTLKLYLSAYNFFSWNTFLHVSEISKLENPVGQIDTLIFVSQSNPAIKDLHWSTTIHVSLMQCPLE